MNKCQFEIWDKEEKRMGPCGEVAEQSQVQKGRRPYVQLRERNREIDIRGYYHFEVLREEYNPLTPLVSISRGP